MNENQEKKNNIIQLKYPMMSLCKCSLNNRTILATLKPFGINENYKNHIEEMNKTYYYPNLSGKTITFRPATTTESLYLIQMLSREDISWKDPYQLGLIVKTSEGIFVNPPNDERGKPITDNRILELLLNGSEKVKGIYVVEDGIKKIKREKYELRDFGFAPYSTFDNTYKEKIKDTIVEKITKVSNPKLQGHIIPINTGLARVLEHTKRDIAENFKNIYLKIVSKCYEDSSYISLPDSSNHLIIPKKNILQTVYLKRHDKYDKTTDETPREFSKYLGFDVLFEDINKYIDCWAFGVVTK